MSSSCSTTSHAAIPSKVTISLSATFQYSSANGPFMAWCQSGISSLLASHLALTKKGWTEDKSHKDFSEGATITTIIGSKGDEFGERTSKKFFSGRRCHRHGIQHRITNLIPKTIALFTLEFLAGDWWHEFWNLLRSKGTGDFVGLTGTARLAFPNLLALV